MICSISLCEWRNKEGKRKVQERWQSLLQASFQPTIQTDKYFSCLSYFNQSIKCSRGGLLRSDRVRRDGEMGSCLPNNPKECESVSHLLPPSSFLPAPVWAGRPWLSTHTNVISREKPSQGTLRPQLPGQPLLKLHYNFVISRMVEKRNHIVCDFWRLRLILSLCIITWALSELLPVSIIHVFLLLSSIQWYSMVLVYGVLFYSLFNHLPTEGHFSCFLVLAVTNKCSMNICV